MNSVATFAVLGDSAASGVGDTDHNGVSKGWAYYLAQSFNNPLVYLNLSRPGAKSEEVLEVQLPKLLIHNPTITAVIVGGNDALRNEFSPRKLHDNLRLILKQLKANGSEIVLLQLHDPTKIVPLPKTLGSILKRRIDGVNQVTQAVAAEFGAQVLQTRRIEGIYQRNIWHVDRMHPSKLGHQLLASHFRNLLHPRWDINPIECEVPAKTSKRQSALWMLKKGTPWFFKRSIDLLPAAIFLVVQEYFRRVFPRFQHEQALVYYPEFVNQRESSFIEVFEERVS
jgi:lysophospholipase L1-like esterase